MSRRLLAFLTALITGLILSIVFTLGAPATAPVQAQTQNPWTAQFYSGANNFVTPIAGATATYSTLNLNWQGVPTDGANIAIPGVPADNFSVRFTSTQTFGAGTYTFTLSADDVASVFINSGGTRFPIVTNAGQTPGVPISNGAIIQAGTYTVEVDFYENSAAALIQLSWALGDPTGAPGAPVEPTLTPLPSLTPLPAIPPGSLTGTVIEATVLNIRDAPSLGGNRIGRVLRGQTYAIVGRDSDSRWFLLQLSGYQGWAYGYYLFFNFNEFTAPVVSGNTILGLAGQPDTGVRAQTRATLRLRDAPTIFSNQIGRVTWGAFVPLVGRTADGGWYQIVWRGTVGWVSSGFVRLLEGDLNNVPVR